MEKYSPKPTNPISRPLASDDLEEIKEAKQKKNFMSFWIKFKQEINKIDKKFGNIFDAHAKCNDNNSLSMCFAECIYGDCHEFTRVINDFCLFFVDYEDDCDNNEIKEHDLSIERDDKYDIRLLSELYNVKIRIFELDSVDLCLDVCYEYPDLSDFHCKLPLIELAFIPGNHFNIIIDPVTSHSFPLGNANHRKHDLSVKCVRLLNKSPILLFECRLYSELKSSSDKPKLCAVQVYPFLKSSNIREKVLYKIWSLIVGNREYISFGEFVQILELIYVVQNSQCGSLQMNYKIIIKNIKEQTQNGSMPLPNMHYPIPVPFALCTVRKCKSVPAFYDNHSDKPPIIKPKRAIMIKSVSNEQPKYTYHSAIETESELLAFGFGLSYVKRAFKLYKKDKFGYNYAQNGYRFDVIMEIVCRLQEKDQHQSLSVSYAMRSTSPSLQVSSSVSSVSHQFQDI